MSSASKKYVFAAGFVIVLASGLFFAADQKIPEAPVSPTIPADVFTAPTLIPSRSPETIPVADGPLKDRGHLCW